MANSFAAQLADALENSWPAIARRNQLPPPGDWWQIWLLLAGRGFGKTRTLAEWVCQQAASSGALSRRGRNRGDPDLEHATSRITMSDACADGA
jgi:phage terminase large subunit-like protein